MTKKSIIISVISVICLVGIVSFAMYGCSSILSKYAFYQYFNNMSRSLKVKLPRGNTSSVVDHVAVSIAKKYGKKMLLKVTKTNMTNYKRIKDVI